MTPAPPDPKDDAAPLSVSRPVEGIRERALDAAIAIASREGVATLTIDAVAKEAGVSKGGVLHHFRTKEMLILAMVERLVAAFEAVTQATAAADPKPVGRFTRAFVDAVLSPELTRIGRALVAVVAVNPALLDPLRASFQRCYARLEADGIDPVDANMCALVADAIWLKSIFDLPPTPPAVERAIRERLRASTTKAKKKA
jgi:AcrR family transcriptional regulator